MEAALSSSENHPSAEVNSQDLPANENINREPAYVSKSSDGTFKEEELCLKIQDNSDGQGGSNSQISAGIACDPLMLYNPDDTTPKTILNYNLPGKNEEPVRYQISMATTAGTEVSTASDETASKYKAIDLVDTTTGPKLYEVKGVFVSQPLKIGKLPEAFMSLPVSAEVSDEDDVNSVTARLLRDFVGSLVDDQQFEKLTRYCSPDNLKTGMEMVMKSKYPESGFSAEEVAASADDEGQLETVRRARARVRDSLMQYYTKNLKYRGVRFLPYGLGSLGRAEPAGERLVPGRDLIYCLRFYRPYSYCPKERIRAGNRPPIFSNDLLVLGRNTLLQLRDSIACANDHGLRADVSAARGPARASSKDLFPSGFLFINNVFYNDCRSGRHDLSAPLRDWAARRGLGALPACDAAQPLSGLTVRLGHPEVYIHQGSCEHVFTFSWVRLATARDAAAPALQPALFPCSARAGSAHAVYCGACAEFAARWVVAGCARVPFDPAYFCDACYRTYLFKDGAKVGEFKAYEYNTAEMAHAF